MHSALLLLADPVDAVTDSVSNAKATEEPVV